MNRKWFALSIDQIEEKLDSVFGLHFLGQFFNSGLESVPVVDDDEDELDEFEEEIVNYFRKNKGILTLEKLAKKFNSIPKGDLKDIANRIREYTIKKYIYVGKV